MLRVLFIEKGKDRKARILKHLILERMILKIVKLKVSLTVTPLMEVRYLLYFKIISNQQSVIIGVSEFEK